MSVDMGMRQSLIEAGLVDPASGSFLSAPNFGEDLGGDAPRDPLPDPVEDPAEQPPQATPAAPETVQPTPSQPVAPSPAPASPADPASHDPRKLGEDTDPVRRTYEATVTDLRQKASEAVMMGRMMVNAEGQRVFTDQQIDALVGEQLALAEHRAYLDGVMQRMQPVAKRAAAEKYAQEYGVDIADIMDEPTPIAMETRAKTISDLMRDGRFQKRKEAATDAAEGSRNFNNAIPEGLDKLSPQGKIYAGLARGDR